MANRRSSGGSDPFDDDPFESEADDVDLGDLNIDAADADLGDMSADDGGAVIREPVTFGQIIGGFFQVILLGVLVIALFLALGFGVIFAAQRIGIVPTRAPNPEAGGLILLPTPFVAEPTAAPQDQAVPTAAAVVLTSTPDLGCPNAATWWNSQPIQSNYTYFTQQALADVKDAKQPISALIQQMGIHRSFVANVPTDACLGDVRDAMLQSYDATIDEARVMGTSDEAGLTDKELATAQAYAKLNAALWGIGVSTDATTAVPDKGTRGTGASCGAQTWYASVKPHLDSFNSTAEQIDPTLITRGTMTDMINTLHTERGNVIAVVTPECATQAAQALTGAMDSDIQYFEQILAGNNADAQLSDYNRQLGLYLTWLAWLGVS